MKILFLDFDGVMNCQSFIRSLEQPFNTTCDSEIISPDAIIRLNKIIRETKAEVVVSSVWRKTKTAFMLQCMMLRHGFEGEIIDTTPNSAKGIRGLEIQDWLDRNSVEAFVILDDSSDMAHLMPRLIQTTFEDGLQDCHVEKAIEMLGN
jgi:hypothetical protein